MPKKNCGKEDTETSESDSNSEIDEEEMLDKMDYNDIFEMGKIGTEDCKFYFGDKLLDEFTDDEVIKHFGIEVAE